MKWIVALTFFRVASAVAGAEATLYENNFQQAEVGQVPAEFLVLEGGFAVKQEGENRLLELPGAPLDSFGVIFGPTEGSNVVVKARIQGTAKGRRFPTFGVGLLGQGGFRLLVSPGKKALELYRGEERLASADFAWESGTWTWLKLQVTKSGASEWKIEGKAWADKSDEPRKWAIAYSSVKKASDQEVSDFGSGRASIWGNPYAGTPIRFDDLVVARAVPEK